MRFFESVPRFRRSKCHFLALENGHFWVDILVMRFYFRASIKPIFENHVFRAVLGPFHPLYETKISNRSLSVVYGSITLNFFRGLWKLVRTSGSTDETKFKRSIFLGTPYCLGHFKVILNTSITFNLKFKSGCPKR